ncbi:conjugal transfer protein [Erwinia sp. OLTSP20]|uniref:ATPase, T2SS/T4P/T4SS family n=1 Tax=Enterobacterales TaxID=91347 RepID=UPI000C199018|nr:MULTISPECIES: ATPase, T2SS/T4P/T4SS family [Enterobacterales]PII85121.1 conjugal transfer protein [Serratia sp. OLFL2]PIJ49382.1 conjugal transfer protein [Erwinia sp. OAMSP11]PIJ69739.1 conjugal transfer protein [Erwinia sp. OLSSP12]PIJ76223.1 conjugal transfer protein [Erwinia sp. OLCASP19]PIJ76744.1 conjugal transfer protein [Erwinia sp. OLMTSP26]
MPCLKESDFIDIYIGNDYAEIKGLKGAKSYLVEIPDELQADVAILKEKCLSEFKKRSLTEFSVVHDSRLYRVTITLFSGTNLVIRQTPEKIMPIQSLPFNSALRTSIEIPHVTGLFLIVGEMGSGKTTTAAAVLGHRIASTGNLGVSIEDPIETMLMGRHGQGRCIQLEVSGDETYATATKKAFRMGATSFLLGEIRDGATAHEVLKASLSMFVVSTIHASSVQEAIERYIMFCEEFSDNAKSHVATTLYVVAHQVMNSIIKDEQIIKRNVEISGFNFRHAKSADTIRAKIAAGNLKSLSEQFRSMEYSFPEQNR